MKRHRTIMACALALGLLTASASADSVTLEPAAMERAGVRTETVLERSFGDRIRIVGEVVRSPGTTLTLKTPVQGRIDGVLVAPGSSVRAGDPLIVLHSHEIHALEGEALMLRQGWELARSKAESGAELYDLEGISRMDLEQRRHAARAAEIAYQEALHDLEDMGFDEADIEALFRRNEADGTVTVDAPAAGVVLEMPVQLHQWTEAFEALLVLGNPREMELEIQIQPSDATRVSRGDRIEFVPVGQPGTELHATVLTPIPRVDPRTRTVTARATILDGAASLFPGMFVEGTLTHGDARSSLAVPESAVIRIGSGDHVFVRVAADSETFEARAVSLGRTDGAHYEVTSGLQASDEVVVEGVFLLKSVLLQQQGE